MNVVEEAEDGEVSSSDAVPTKVHIRGLDNLTTADIKAFVEEHYTGDVVKRVEWIDDTSANLIFDTSEAATDALIALSAQDSADVLSLRPAKQASTHPNTQLEIRQAIAADIKLPGAKDRSRFYLLNPEYDPDNRIANRKRRYHGDRNGSYKRRRSDDRQNRAGSSDGSAFNVDFYDDNGAAPKPHEADIQKKRSQFQDLFANRKPSTVSRAGSKDDGRLRDRSASPVRDGNGKYGFDEEQPYRRTARQRSATPPHLRKARKREYGAEDGKDLPRNTEDLADTDFHKVNRNKELFPDKNGAAHRRSDAKDLNPDHVADIFGKYTFDESHDRRAYGHAEPKTTANKGDLFDRVGNGKKDHGRLNGLDNGRGDREGFSILGAAKDRLENPLVKELFPLKTAGEQKDLFDGRIKGRATQRRRAEDLF